METFDPGDSDFSGQIQQRAQLQNAGSLHRIHWLIIGASLALTIAAWYVARSQVREKIRERFRNEAGDIIELISERMAKYEEALWAGAAAIHANGGDMSPQQWRRFATKLRIEQRYPGINGIGIVNQLAPEDVPAFIAEQRLERLDFSIHPPHSENEYWPILCIEPIKTNCKALGLDMAHEHNRLTAARKTRDSGDAQITGPIVLVQDDEHTPGFLFFVPYYLRDLPASSEASRRRDFGGLVYAPFIMNRLMLGMLRKERRDLGIQISDADTLLYDEHKPGEPNFDPDPLFQDNFEIPFYGRIWRFDIRAGSSFRADAASRQPLLILLFGIIIDIMLLTFFLLLNRANRQSVAFADTMTTAFQSKTIALRDNELRLRAVIENAADGIALFDHEQVIEDFNPACEALFGVTAANAVGKKMTTFFPVLTRGDFRDYMNTRKSGDDEGQVSKSREMKGLHEDGSEFDIDLQIRNVRLPDRVLYMATIRNITERKASERRLEQYTHELERSNDDLDNFAYVASHDLKAPLRVIDNASVWLEEDLAEHFNADTRESMALLRNRVRRMEKLLDDLLEYSRAGRKLDERYNEPINGNVLIENVVTLVSAPDGFRINSSANFRLIEVNRMPLQQILFNLISNAVKHHHKTTGAIDIDLDISQDDYIFGVADDGPGIAVEFHAQVFKMFQTLQPRDRVEGSGMGLAMVKKNIELFGGAIYLQSTPGEGSRFYFSWPRVQRIHVPGMHSVAGTQS